MCPNTGRGRGRGWEVEWWSPAAQIGRQLQITSGVSCPCKWPSLSTPVKLDSSTAFRVHPLPVWASALAALPSKMPLLLICTLQLSLPFKSLFKPNLPNWSNPLISPPRCLNSWSILHALAFKYKSLILVTIPEGQMMNNGTN